MDKINAAEALFGFMGWLTTRETVVSVGSHCECAPAADAVKAFCDANNLEEPRGGWHKNVVHPPEESGEETRTVGSIREVVCLKPAGTEESVPVEVIPIDPDARYVIIVRGEFGPGEMTRLCDTLDEWWTNDNPFFVFGAGNQDVEFHKVTKGIDECPETIETS